MTNYLTICQQLHRQGVQHLSLHSCQLNASTAFVAIQGAKQHGLAFLADAIAAQAPCVIIDASESIADTAIPVIRVENLMANLGHFAAEFYQHPSQYLALHAVTGTNGKTSCSQFMAQALTLLGERCGVIGTLGMGIWPTLTANANTTPDAISLQRFLAEMVQQQVKHVCMEASSIALVAGRMQACEIRSAIFTNLTQDHLDYHQTMEAYGAAKQMLFDFPGIKQAIINADDVFGQRLLQQYATKLSCWSFGSAPVFNAVVQHLQILQADFTLAGIKAEVRIKDNIVTLVSPLLGQFNLENLLAVLAWLLAQQIDLGKALTIIQQLKSVAGRMACCGGEGESLVVIDYAHTPDALEKVLKALRLHCTGKLWCVFGCGGNRDKTKRPLMGEIADRLADYVIVTSDNPRDEDPSVIVQQIIAERDMHAIVDRAQAIAYAIAQAKAEDIILIAGKGHETYQEIKDKKIDFNDLVLAQTYLKGRSLA